MEDMIPKPNSVTRPISRLDSLISELINESEESVFCQPLTDPYIPNLLIGLMNHVILGIQIQFQNTHLNLTTLQVMKVS